MKVVFQSSQDRPARPRITRRTCLPLVGCALLFPAALTSAQTEGVPWQPFRRDDLGFELEVPGKLNVWNDMENPDMTRHVDGYVNHDGIHFGLSFFGRRQPRPLDVVVRGRLGGLDWHKRKLTRETPLTT